MEKVFVDTSAWVALFVENDRYHKEAIAIFEYIRQMRMSFYTSDYVIDETITTILVKGGHKQSVLAGCALLRSQIIKIVYVSPDHFDRTWLAYQKYKDKEFSFTDVASFAVMKDLNIAKAFAFDQHFLQAGIQLAAIPY